MTEPVAATQVRPYAVPWRQGLKQAVYVHDLGSLLALLSCKCRINVSDVRDLRQHYFGYDKQTGWSAWLVSYRGSAILWSNGPVPDLQRFHL